MPIILAQAVEAIKTASDITGTVKEMGVLGVVILIAGYFFVSVKNLKKEVEKCNTRINKLEKEKGKVRGVLMALLLRCRGLLRMDASATIHASEVVDILQTIEKDDSDDE